MKSPKKIILLFVLIFLVGVLGFVARINSSLENSYNIELEPSNEELNK